MKKLFVVILVLFSTIAFAGDWEQRTFKDDFGDPTGAKFVAHYDSTGIFANSAVSWTTCPVYVMVTDKSTIGVFLYEHGGSTATSLSGSGTVAMKNEAGMKMWTTVRGKWNPRGGISLYNEHAIISFLMRSEGIVKVVIKDGYSATYKFLINVDGFPEAYKEMHKYPDITKY